MSDAAQFDIALEGLQAVIRKLDLLAVKADQVMERALFRIGTLVRDTAREYAPRSPTSTDLRNSAKAKGSTRRRRNRNPRSTSATKPGGLERSIDFKVSPDEVEIFVADNSEAGAYAFFIHEQKGSQWNERGIGTVSKGELADEKFIERAIEDEADAAFRIIEDEMEKLLLAA